MITQQDVPATIAMPVREFVHPDTGGRVTVIGTIHAASPQYYAALGELLADLDAAGAVIHYEHVGEPTADEWASAAPEITQGAEDIRKRLDTMYARFTSVGLALQKDALVMREDWQNHDLSRIGAAEFYGEQVIRQQQKSDTEADLLLANFTPAVLRALLLQTLAASGKVVTGEVDRDSVLPGVERQLAMLRETIALAAVDVRRAVEPHAHVVLVWGAAHLPGFSRGLAARGYKEDGERWLTAIDPATLPPLD